MATTAIRLFAIRMTDRTEQLRASPPLLKSGFVDRFTRVHPTIPLIIFVPLTAYLLYRAFGPAGVYVPSIVGLFIAGILFWSLLEYWMHRLVFHFTPRGRTQKKIVFLIHGVHHEHPNDPKRLVMPPLMSVPLALIFWLIFRLALGPELFLPAFAGLLTGYLIYDMGHYHWHHHKPRTKIGKHLNKHHMLHHFDSDKAAYGVSSPMWDYVFGTRPQRH